MPKMSSKILIWWRCFGWPIHPHITQSCFPQSSSACSTWIPVATSANGRREELEASGLDNLFRSPGRIIRDRNPTSRGAENASVSHSCEGPGTAPYRIPSLTSSSQSASSRQAAMKPHPKLIRRANCKRSNPLA
ncbi:uncharacterized protein BDV14DRAFT_101027 [Aspergillus stella-maris]|uniref:uncharacterized protein n=1 Tax=Aspergillus stella-maris TaxID=1810926 RepID=UPI003CCCECCD